MEGFDFNCAVLISCHNRKKKTLGFLDSLHKEITFSADSWDVYLLDDGSTDGTSDAVKAIYPEVRIINGTGNLFWAGGMRVLWKHALDQKKYDLFLLCNDDVILIEGSLKRLIASYQLAGPESILIGSTLSSITKKITYGGHLLNRLNHAGYYLVKPDEQVLKPCHLGNANVFLVGAAVVRKVGIFDGAYTHYLADYDYTLTAFKAGIKVLLAPGYYGFCEDDHGPNWLSGKHSLRQRVNYLYSVKGLAYHEYLFYIKKHFPADYSGAIIKLWMKTLFPFIWDNFKKVDN
ncbi:glycosyltransferase family 2 protein [Mucilaginibacter terrenus]|uniref:Glycosyltransferase family 2 protein n=1 Tax=Mucilaginibacter terrenus TaxID=2482727 RepID=A0A3E2NYP2_9SPHI|nr:glycosyltransferase family 2 protein [Mucilaginibacter terrenus]RFZ86107.1 glycosyltransferase family 2 protein [Mucilaginibacter terrenus]